MNDVNRNAQLFRYCPKCGAAGLRLHTAKLFKCGSCGFEFFLNTATAVAGVITDRRGNLLVTVRAREPGKGTWDLPGGFADPGESAEEALKREAKEELGLDVLSARYFCSAPSTYEYKGVTYEVVDLAYICEVEDASKAKAMDDVQSVLFLSPAEIDFGKFGGSSTRDIVSHWVSKGHKANR
jgi:NAD+ diphosphatase